jgi:hypothetical protein
MTETSPIAIRDAGLRSSDQLVEQSGEIIRQKKIIVAKNKKIWRSDAPQETLDTAAAMTALGLGRVKTLREKCAFRDPGIGARVG